MWTTKELLKAKPELFNWWINDEPMQMLHGGLFHDVFVVDGACMPTTWIVNGKSLNHFADTPGELIFRNRNRVAEAVNSVKKHLLSGDADVIISYNQKEYTPTLLLANSEPIIQADGRYIPLWNLPYFRWETKKKEIKEKVEDHRALLEKLIVDCVPIRYCSNIGLLSKSGDRYYIGAFYINLSSSRLYDEFRVNAKNAITGEPLWTK